MAKNLISGLILTQIWSHKTFHDIYLYWILDIVTSYHNV